MQSMNYSKPPAPSYAAVQRHLQVESPGARKPFSRASSRNMNGPLYKQSADKVVLVRRKRKGAGVVKQLARWFVENQIGT
jgi:acyl-CoA-dependent ceramide synthase